MTQVSKRKSMAITTILAILIGGVGHIYVGKVKRGIVILLIDLVSCAIFSIAQYLSMPQDMMTHSMTTDMPYFGVYVAAVIGLVIFFIWQIIDARKECRKYNSSLVWKTSFSGFI